VWLGSLSGPVFIGKAEFVTDRAIQDQMIARISQKYFLARIGLFGPKRANFDSGKIVTIRITPEREPARGMPVTTARAGPDDIGSLATMGDDN
jgi:hypothetical protein